MPATVTSKETFPKDVVSASLDVEVGLRLQAGAIRSWYEKTSDGWTLFTEWNVIGQQ